ncbi:MAG TPA: Rieske 2Fe-2S domain-containing protein [Solirubrobacteraceae bacterium]
MSWHRVLDAEELEQATPIAMELQGREICVVRLQQDIHAFDDACPHRQWPLHLGHLKDGILTCRAHTWEWDVRTGELQRMRAPECLTMHEARERDGAIEVRLDPEAPEPLLISALWRATQELEVR